MPNDINAKLRIIPLNDLGSITLLKIITYQRYTRLNTLTLGTDRMETIRTETVRSL